MRSVKKKLPTFKTLKAAFKALKKGKLPKNTVIAYDSYSFFIEAPVLTRAGPNTGVGLVMHTFYSGKGEELISFLLKRSGIKVKFDE